MNTAFIGVGSNLGERESQLAQGLSWVGAEVGSVVQVSAIYQTKPWGNIDQPDYLNQVWQISTRLNPFQLMDTLLDLEQRGKRKRIEKWGARTLDLDLLFYEDYRIQTAELVLPHPRLHLRNFVLIPLAEIAADLEHPVFGKTIQVLSQESQDTEAVEIWTDALGQ